MIIEPGSFVLSYLSYLTSEMLSLSAILGVSPSSLIGHPPAPACPADLPWGGLATPGWGGNRYGGEEFDLFSLLIKELASS